MAKKKKWKRQGKKPAAVERQTASGKAASSPKEDDVRGTAAKLMARWGTAICLAAIAVLGIIIYANTFSVPFLFDDQANIVNNDGIHSLAALLDRSGFERIVGYLTFMANYRIGGLDVAGYHIFNIAVHVANALMVFGLAALTLRAPYFRRLREGATGFWPATLVLPLFCGLLFVAYPVQTQAVTYIVQRFASLATFFYLLAVLAYVRSRLIAMAAEAGPDAEAPPAAESGTPSAGRTLVSSLVGNRFLFYGVALAAAVLAAGTKEIAFTLPAVLALWEFSFGEGSIKKRLFNLLPFLAAPAVVILAHLSSHSSLFQAEGQMAPTTVPEYLMTQFRVIVTYLRLMVLPVNQNLDYDYPVYRSLADANVFLSLAGLLLVAGAGVLLYYISGRRKDLPLLRLAGFGIFWFFITLSVESSVIRIPDLIFEHRLYLPSIGFIIAVVALLEAAVLAAGPRRDWPRKALIAGLSLAVLALSVATFARNNVWRQVVTIWEDTAAKSPGKVRPHNNLGIIYKNRGELLKAEEQFKLAIAAGSDYAQPYNNLGSVYQALGQLDKAEEQYRLAIANTPAYAEAHNNLGVIYNRRGDLARAEDEFKQAIAVEPDYENAYFNLGINYMLQKKYPEATSAFNRVAEINPGDYEAHNQLGNVYAYQGQYDKAIAQYQLALKNKPDFQEAKDNLNQVRRLMGSS